MYIYINIHIYIYIFKETMQIVVGSRNLEGHANDLLCLLAPL